MRALVARDLADAQVRRLSADRRFATAYNAALQTANMAIACAGYRVTAKAGHHKITVEAITLAVGAAMSAYADYFETCRRLVVSDHDARARNARSCQVTEVI